MEHFKQQIGIGRVLYIPVAAQAADFLVCMWLKETMPSMVGAVEGEPVKVEIG